jgi:hypothetical protein
LANLPTLKYKETHLEAWNTWSLLEKRLVRQDKGWILEILITHGGRNHAPLSAAAG